MMMNDVPNPNSVLRMKELQNRQHSNGTFAVNLDNWEYMQLITYFRQFPDNEDAAGFVDKFNRFWAKG